MSNSNSRFVWYELTTTDCPAAASFYRSVFGWEAKDSGLTDRKYTLLFSGPTGIAGMFPIPPNACDAASRPFWIGYIASEVDADTARVVSAGGSILRSPEDIPGVGRFAVVADPYGAPFVLFRGTGSEEPTPAPRGTPGHVDWHELHAGDGDGAFAFYSNLFGWTKADAIDMGSMGSYQIFAIDGVPTGGMMTKMPQTPAPFWLYYVNVDSIEAALSRVKLAGGQPLFAPHEVPGGGWMVHCLDPQGAIFAMFSTKP